MTGPVFEFSEVFDDDYLHFYGPQLEAVSEANAETIWRLLDLTPGMEVLDLACGHGRVANRLAQRGARVTGLDAMPRFLDQARRDALRRGVEVDYVRGDMRSLPWPDHRFDRVISWFTSFGYFDDTENHQVLSEAHRVLRPGGRLLLENNNLAELLPRFSVRMFIGVELHGWLLAAGFNSVNQVDHGGAALAATSGRMVSVAHKEIVGDI